MRSPEDMRIIQIDITNACVHTCSNCSRMCGHHKKPFFMDFKTFKQAVDSLDGFEGTIGIMGGEPTLHPEFERFTRYLASKYPKKEVSCLIEPTDDFIRNLKYEEQMVTEQYYEKAGDNARVSGPGLWSSLISKYGDYYELIQDSFLYQCVNDHTISCYHQPVMVCRKDLDVPDDEWIEMRDNCWMQMNWSASITPKGAFFCEVAAALDMLFDGPGGWPIEQGWWKREPKDFAEQLHWCEWCGLALETRSRDANEGIDDVSETFYERLRTVDSPKLKKGLVNIYHKDESEDKSLIRHNQYHDKEVNRLGADNTSIYPKGFCLIIVQGKGACEEDIQSTLESAKGQFSKIEIIRDSEPLGRRIINDNIAFGNKSYVVIAEAGIEFAADFVESMKKYVINPGVLHILNANTESENGLPELIRRILDSSLKIYLYNTSARALAGYGRDRLYDLSDLDSLSNIWDQHKTVTITNDVLANRKVHKKTDILSGTRYVVYGAGQFGKKAFDLIEKANSETIFFIDSNGEKWGSTYLNRDVISPSDALKRCGEYDKVIIAALAYHDIRKRLLAEGFSEDDIIFPVYLIEE